MASRKNLCKDYTVLLNFASVWVSECFKPFTTDDLKKAFYAAENPPIQNVKAVGAVMMVLAKEESIYKTDNMATSTAKGAKGRMLRVFISKEYKKRQKNNRLAPYKSQTDLFKNEPA